MNDQNDPLNLPDGFSRNFSNLLLWRRDVRHFRPDPVDTALIERLVAQTNFSPSVGNSQPWRFVCVNDPDRRGRMIENFQICTADAAKGYQGVKAQLYASLKLEGLKEAPVHLAVFCDSQTVQGAGLGSQTMPQMLEYSVAMAVHTLWLSARIEGLGVGWVSILDPDQVCQDLDISTDWKLIAYLCIGWPAEHSDTPELQQRGWQSRRSDNSQVIER
ncbi:MAG: 5,6-dimethylbenzimidazole synthase [Stappiaceae bacterium]